MIRPELTLIAAKVRARLQSGSSQGGFGDFDDSDIPF